MHGPLDIVTYDGFQALGYNQVQKLEFYGQKYISFKNLKNQVKVC